MFIVLRLLPSKSSSWELGKGLEGGGSTQRVSCNRASLLLPATCNESGSGEGPSADGKSGGVMGVWVGYSATRLCKQEDSGLEVFGNLGRKQGVSSLSTMMQR